MTATIRIKDCIDNHDRYVAVMAALPDKELAIKLDLVHTQMQLAEQTKNTASLELLEIWRAQIIEARICKAENNIPDSPNEIELAIADIVTIEARGEQLKAILTGDIKGQSWLKKQGQDREKKSPGKEEQLSLF